MISNNLKHLFLLSLIPIYLHGMEEIVNGFQQVDVFMVYGASYFQTTPEVFYWISHIIWWVSLPLLYLLLNKSRFALPLMTVFSLVFIIELHHPIKGLLIHQYYPGMITALFYPIFGLFYWQQLIREWRNKK